MILDNIDEIVFTIHPSNNGPHLGFVSGRVTDVLGYTPDEMSRICTSVIHPADLDIVQARTSDALTRGIVTTFHCRVRRRDGQYRSFENRLRPATTTAENRIVYGVARDVTDSVDREPDKRSGDGDEQQAHKMEALGRLAGGIAHDFNNLLTTIGGNASFVLELLPSADSTTREALGDILAACDRAARFTRQLLAFSRKQVLQPEPLQIHAVIADMQLLLSRLLGPEYRLDVHAAGQLPAVACDRGQLEQVVMNLVVNARDAMPSGGPISVTTRLATVADEPAVQRIPSRSAQTVVLEVTDTGGGIPAEIQERIFEPFFTTKDRGKGTGLGLAMVYGFVRQSGGHVELASRPGHGTTFSIYLPAITSSEGAVAPAVATVSPRQQRQLTVMVVDDDPGVRNLASAMLKRSGCAVIEASDGADAERIATAHRGGIDVLLTDIVMPGIRGPDLALRLREVRPGMRVVYMSGFRDTEPLADVDSGDAVFLPKPFVRSTLLEAIGKIGTSA